MKHTKVTDLTKNSLDDKTKVNSESQTKKDSVPSNQIAEEGQKSTKSTPTIPQKERIRKLLDGYFYEYDGDLDNLNEATEEILDIVNQARVDELDNYRSMIFQFGKWRKLGIEMSEEEVNDRIKELEGKK